MVIKKLYILLSIIFLVAGCSEKKITFELREPVEVIIPFPNTDDSYYFAGTDDTKVWFLEKTDKVDEFWFFDISTHNFKKLDINQSGKILNVRSYQNGFAVIEYNEISNTEIAFQVYIVENQNRMLLLEGITNDYYTLPTLTVYHDVVYIMSNTVIARNTNNEVTNHEWKFLRYDQNGAKLLDSWTSDEKGVVPFHEFNVNDHGITYRKIRGVNNHYEIIVTSITDNELKENFAKINTRTVGRPILTKDSIYLQERISEENSVKCQFRIYDRETQKHILANYDLGMCFYSFAYLDENTILGTLEGKYYILNMGKNIISESFSLNFMDNVYRHTNVGILKTNNKIFFLNTQTNQMYEIATLND